ncbi:spherulation-specific family 4 protein [Kitasatospora sp. NBC_01287]|uniref:spherulation-specific family 4 protein n=1 Tax=Kitasatospora sp. NBC_01287 TaxID=2903573 RepID=UPI002B1E1ECF|nr:spherulation-specific family 4 protein [Kitasatospora sp. NBC_01287]
MNSTSAARLLVPLYVHPAVDPAAWQAVAAAGPERVRAVVLNVANGPGPEPDQAFVQAAAELAGAGIPLLGYVDTGYGRRPHAEVVAEVLNHRQWYGTTGVYFDQAAAHQAALAHYRRLTTAARAAGCELVVLGHGVHPEPSFAGHELGDVLVTFEGSWSEYDALVLPLWTGHHPAERFCHLVYGVPAERAEAAGALLASRRAGVGCAVPGSGTNPWSELPYGLGTADAPPAPPAPQTPPAQLALVVPPPAATGNPATPPSKPTHLECPQ